MAFTSKRSLASAILLAIVLFELVVFALADCPHSCSNHGSCRHGFCACDDGWVGDDCSEFDRELESGEQVSGSLNSFTWHYYHISVTLGVSALNITMHQTSRYGDVDVYVQRDSFPTEREYYARDITSDPDVVLSISHPPPGRYFIGLYGYWHCEYDLVADVIVDCPVDCGPHGHCDGRNCVCDVPYAGESCSIYDRLLSSGSAFSDELAVGEWKYYHIQVPERNSLSITTVEAGRGDVDLYVKHLDYPTFFDFDYLNGTIAPTATLFLDEPAPGTWYIGVYGYRADSYTITATLSAVTTCRGQCSGSSHGTCVGRSCQCTSDYTGDYCERKRTPLQLDSSVTGFVETNLWNYYQIRAVTQNNLVVSVVQTGDNMDCDMYIRSGEEATRVEYDYANLSLASSFNITIQNPGDSEWHIGVYGWRSCSYTLTTHIPIHCSCSGGHGYCEPNSDVCICYPGWGGVGCDQSATVLQNGDVYTGQSVQQFKWRYYTISANSSALLVSMRETETRGFLWMFGSESTFPTLDSYDEADKETKTDFHEVHFVYRKAELRTYYIGVYGNPFDLRAEDAVPFTITAWAPPF